MGPRARARQKDIHIDTCDVVFAKSDRATFWKAAKAKAHQKDAPDNAEAGKKAKKEKKAGYFAAACQAVNFHVGKLSRCKDNGIELIYKFVSWDLKRDYEARALWTQPGWS